MFKMKTQDELEKEIISLKPKYGSVYSLTPLNDEEEEEWGTILVSKPSRETLALIGKLANGTDALKAIEAFLKNCYVGGDALDPVYGNTDALRSIESAVVSIITPKKAILKKN